MRTLADYQKFVESGCVIHLNGDIEDNMINRWRKQLHRFIKSGEQEVAITLNTYGGSVSSGLLLYYEMRALSLSESRRAFLVCQGKVCSMGMYVLNAIPQENRVAFPHTGFFSHLGTVASKKVVDASQDDNDPWEEYCTMEEQAEEQRDADLEDDLRQLLVTGTNLSAYEVDELILNPRYIHNDEAVRMGFIDRILI